MRVLCALCVGIILVAGLWPFHSPRNNVQWLEHGNGVQLRAPAVILSSGPIWTNSGATPTPCSLELWLQPAETSASSTILSLYNPASPIRVSLRQSLSDLALQSESRHSGPDDPIRLYVDRLFVGGRSTFITITSNPLRTAVYIDGKLAETRSRFPLLCPHPQPWIVAGTSPVAPDGWSGALRGLAFYPVDLSPREVAQHHAQWMSSGHPDFQPHGEKPALYLFQEHSGSLLHSVSGSGPDLRIPQNYQIVDKLLLSWPNRWNWNDILLNWAGFIPLGACLCLLNRRSPVRALLVTTLLGMALSLAIEILQIYLPTRDSDLTDVITNTLGTASGALLCQAAIVRSMFTRVGWLKA
ncbi:MAG: VanZ family protein [Acidobacteria bacterium]|nr:VanZ family protein [Acidobacteriota bacterium]